jgi:integrase
LKSASKFLKKIDLFAENTLMQGIAPLLKEDQLAYVLNINLNTLDELVYRGDIPHTYIQGKNSQEIRFNPYLVLESMNSKENLKQNSGNYLTEFKEYIKDRYPNTIKELEKINNSFKGKKSIKGYYLEKVFNKKYGFIYYVKYIHNGQTVKSRWSTGTNDEDAANRFARENRDIKLKRFFAKNLPEFAKESVYYILENYYKKDSPFLKEDIIRGRSVAEKTRRIHYNFIRKVFTPYLRKNHVLTIEDITAKLIDDFRIDLSKDGVTNATINHYIGGIKAIFKFLAIKDVIKYNIFSSVDNLKQKSVRKKCYYIDILKGVFNQKWESELEYLLIMVAYATNLRNSGIERIKPQDFYLVKDCQFLRVYETKSESSDRSVPVHPFVYKKIMSYVRKHKIRPDQYIFSAKGGPNQSTLYNRANYLLCQKLYKKLKIKQTDIVGWLKREKISFLSSRHFWKTVMSAEGLGEEPEKVFMGHKVPSNVSDRYTHHDKYGQALLVKKAKKIFTVLDKKVFMKTT